MDTPRRWQVASLATAVASLGFGAAVLARPVVEVVPSIDLDQVDHEAPAPPIQPDRSVDTAGDPVQPMIVLPRSIASPTAASVAEVSAASPSPVTVTTAGSLDSPAADNGATTGPTSAGSSDAPGSVDSPDSVGSSG